MTRKIWNLENMNEYASQFGYKVLEIKIVIKPYQNQTWALIQCPEGHKKWQWWNNFITGYRCRICKGYTEWDEKTVKDFLSKYNLKLISEYKNVDKCFIAETKEGYLVRTNISTLKAATKRNKLGTNRTFNLSKGFSLFSKEVALENLRRFCKIERPEYELCSTEWKGIKAKYCFKYIGPIEVKNRYFETYGDTFYYARQGHPDLSMSKGSFKIYHWLYNNNLKFKTEYIFSDLKDVYFLRFDFAILDDINNPIGIIEFHGEQHFNKKNHFYNPIIIEHDKIKKQYCIDNKIPFLEIRYDEEDKIPEMLSNFIQRLEKANNKYNSIILENKLHNVDEVSIVGI